MDWILQLDDDDDDHSKPNPIHSVTYALLHGMNRYVIHS